MAAGDDAFGDVLVGPCARLQVESGCTLHVSGALSNGCEFVACEGSTVEFVGSGVSRIFGDIAFSNILCKASGKVIEVEAGKTLTVNGIGSFAGTSASPVTLRGAAGGAWTLANAGSVSMEGVALGNCTATSSLTIVNGQDLGGNSDNISFVTIQPGETLTWTGAADDGWSNGANWDANRAPIASDVVVIPSGCARYPTIAADAAVSAFSVAEGASATLVAQTLSVTGAVSVAGALAMSGEAILEAGGDLAISGTFAKGLSTVRLNAAASQTLTAGGADFHTLELLAPATVVASDLAADALVVGDGTHAFDCAFAVGAAVAATAFTVNGNAATTNGTLRCATAGGQWALNASQSTVVGAAVSGSDASGGVTIVPTDCRDDGDNVNWLFVDNRTHWDGTAWSDGAPTSEKDAVVDAGATLTVAADLATRNFTVSPGAKVAVNATLAAAGSVVVEPNGAIEWNRPGTIGGNLTILSGATMTHAANTTTEANKIDLAVAGSGYLAAGAVIDVKGCGYGDSSAGPCPMKLTKKGASHGGNGYPANEAPASYGSFACPTNLGSCGRWDSNIYPGGGAVKLRFGGVLTLDGEIDADASAGQYYSGSGGSIWLTAATLRGSGPAHAEGPHTMGWNAGAGGRVAVYLTQATSLADFTGELQAYGGGNKDSLSTVSNPGTVYVETAADGSGAGTLTVANRAGHGSTVEASDAARATDLVAAVCSEPDDTRLVNVVVKDYGVLTLNTNATVRDIRVLDATSLLKLNGHRLRVRSYRHAISPDDTKYVIPGDGGTIVWKKKGFAFFVR